MKHAERAVRLSPHPTPQHLGPIWTTLRVAELRRGVCKEFVSSRPVRNWTGACPTGQGRVQLDAGRVQLDMGRVRLDAGRVRLDAGRVRLDAGRVRLDAGRGQLDMGRVQLDPGRAATG